MQAPGQFRQGRDLVQAVIDPGDEDVFEGDHAAFFLLIILAGGGEVAQRILGIDRHDFAARFVGGAVQGDGQAELERLLRQPPDLRGQAAGRDGDLARADISAPGGVEDFQRLEQVVVIGQGFAHAHDDQIVDQAGHCRSGPSHRSTARTWLTISSGCKLRFQPSRPLAQNLQP